ncbi:hypothetical protein ACFH3Z_000956 [Escherichia coli]|jgi:hypothetical protein|uniref:Uncharacterized protein n=2 Tax=Bacteria TaxID=2 RepID=A0A921K2K5_9LACO|nr:MULTISPECIES: hypothetical protein [Escherichia]EIH0322144.1 hypothetical protein [Escherichia coli O112]MED0631793.1 hypothetical protein [Escherichia marmotae]HJE98110.1 hypothetical protein [Ligilactobacillus acidipiscis]EAB0740384.1 hypothetical protein [Escherichia coli]EAC1715429.1 hypothetical protein [Escherichia coli]
MLCAVCLCPEFVAANISDVKVFSGFFIETIVNGENELILDADGKIRLGYLKSCGNNKDSFLFFKKWESELSKAPSGKILRTPVPNSSEDIKDIVVCAVANAATTFDKHIVVLDNNSYSGYIDELIRQRINLLNLNSISLISKDGRVQRPLNFIKFDSDLSWVLQRLGRRSAKGYGEDDFNDFIRDMLLAKNYEVKDQTREGESQSGKSAGELDLVIEDKGNLFAIIEALILKSLDQANILKHYSKLISNYNPINVKRLFLIAYYTGAKFDAWCERYIDYLKEITPVDIGVESHEIVGIKEVETPYIGLRKIEHHFRYAGEHYFCVHYAVKMAR